MARQIIHAGGEIVVRMYLDASSILLQVLSLLESFVVGAEEDGNTPYCSFGKIVDTHAEAPAHIRHISVAVDAGQEAEAVDEEHFLRGER